jgi:signal transduction histidine kinase
MNPPAVELGRPYLAALQAYLANQDETALQGAYELGRQALRDGFGLMALANAHQQALLSILADAPAPPPMERLCRLAGDFYAECLGSFEMVQRGFHDAHRMLRELNAMLEGRARQLSAANEELKREICGRKQVEKALRQSEENLQALSRKILIAQEEERKRISRELHDEVGQALTAISVSLTMLKKAAAQPLVEDQVNDLQLLLQQTMETIHSFTRELRPAMLDHLGLIPALRAYVRNFGKRTGLRIRFSAVPEVEQLGIEEKTVLYRVIQEGLTNVAKHAHAEWAAVVIRRADRKIRMEVQDNGRAFQVDAAVPVRGKQRLGLLGIQERVRLVKGEFTLESAPGRGTVIRVQIPLKIGGAKAN